MEAAAAEASQAQNVALARCRVAGVPRPKLVIEKEADPEAAAPTPFIS